MKPLSLIHLADRTDANSVRIEITGDAIDVLQEYIIDPSKTIDAAYVKQLPNGMWEAYIDPGSAAELQKAKLPGESLSDTLIHATKASRKKVRITEKALAALRIFSKNRGREITDVAKLPDGMWEATVSIATMDRLNKLRKSGETISQLLLRAVRQDTVDKVLDDNDATERRLAIRLGSTLADHVINAPRNPRRELGKIAHQLGPTSRARLTEISDSVRKASRIFLDPSLVRTAAWFSCQSPSMILAQIPRMLPPGDLIWMEWDERVRLATLEEQGYGSDSMDIRDRTADRAGFLIRTNKEMMSVGVVTQHTQLADAPLILQIAGFWFAPTKIDYDILSLSDLSLTGMIAEEEIKTGHSFAVGERWHMLNKEDGAAYHSINEHICYHWFGVPEPHDPQFPAIERKIPHSAAMSTVGDLRFFLAVLALTSAMETVLDEPWTSSGVRAAANSARLRTPGNVFRTLRVEAPRERLLERMMAYKAPPEPTGRQTRRHGVVAHICRSRRRGSPLCVHSYDREDLPHFCTSCGYREWPRRAHERGDEALGRVYGPRVAIGREGNR